MEASKGKRADVMPRKRKISPADHQSNVWFTGHYVCWACEKTGELIGCSACRQTFHLSCLLPPLQNFPKGVWLCPFCDGDDVVLLDTRDNDEGEQRDVNKKRRSPADKSSHDESQFVKDDDQSFSSAAAGLVSPLLELSRESAGPSEQREAEAHDVRGAARDGLLMLRHVLKKTMKYDLGIPLSESDGSTDEDEADPQGKTKVPEERSAWYFTDKDWKNALENMNCCLCAYFGRENNLSQEEVDSMLKETNQELDGGNNWNMMLTDPNLRLWSNETSDGFSWWYQQLELFNQNSFSDRPESQVNESLTPVVSSTSSNEPFQIPSIILRRGRNGCTRDSAFLFLKKLLKI